MAITKGQISKITAEKAPGVTKVKYGLGWDQPDNGKTDLDAIVLLLGADGKLVDAKQGAIYFNNKSAYGVEHSGDNRTGDAEGYDEKVTIDLASLPAEVTEARVVAYSFPLDDGTQPKFDSVTNVTAAVLNAADDTEIEVFNAGSLGAILGSELGSYQRNGSEWEFKAGGDDINSSLDDYFAKFGWEAPAA